MRRVSRRWLLVGLSAGVAAAAVALPLIRTTGYEVADDIRHKLRFLAPWQYVALSAFGRRILAPVDYDVGSFADEYLAELPSPERDDVSLFIAVVEHVAPFFIGSVRRFSSLDAATQDRVLEALEYHDVDMVRAGFQALKSVALMAYYRLPESWSAIGYDGPAVRWEGD